MYYKFTHIIDENELISFLEVTRNYSADVMRRNSTLIVNGRYMICPRCKKQHDVLRYVPMGQIEEFYAETNPVYKCPQCRWIFSPAAHVLEDLK